MTSNQPPDRLDRIERILDNLAVNQVEERDRRLELRQDLDDEAARWAATIRIVESNARAIAANSDTAARQGEEMRASITDLVSMITTQAEQAEIDRAEFRATVQQILEVLTQRSTSNGH